MPVCSTSVQLIRDLPFATLSQLARHLDPQGQHNWRNLIEKMPPSTYKPVDVELFAMSAQRPGGSPAFDMLKDMGFRGRTVQQLVSYLRKIEHEPALLLLVPEEPVKILKQPTVCITQAGREAQLECHAAGLPFPRYQWYKGKQVLEGGVNHVLYIDRATLADAGQYCCLVKNNVNHVFSEWAEIQVFDPPAHLGMGPRTDLPGMFPPLHSPSQGPPGDAVIVTQQPQNRDCQVGDTLELACSAVGPPPLTYTWFRDGIRMRPSRAGHLVVPGVTYTSTGRYICHIMSETSKREATTQAVMVKVWDSMPPPHSVPVGFQRPLGPTSGLAPTITKHPPPQVICQPGETLKIHCQAKGDPSPKFQWYRNNLPINAVEFQQAMLVLENVDKSDSSFFHCLAKNDFGQQRSVTCQLVVTDSPATRATVVTPTCLSMKKEHTMKTTGSPDEWTRGLDVQAEPPHQDATRFPNLLGKVALVIGNQRYYGEMDPLHHAEADAAELSSLLTSIDNDFKVVSLTNLTSIEMKAAVNYFISLLGKGVFGVFYFAGHGFEHNGENYLMPVDVGLEEAGDGPEVCIRAQDVLRQMQDQKAKLSFLILDVCRTQPDDDKWHAKEVVRPTGLGNAIVGYACHPTKRSFERRSAAHGVYMTHLKEHICEDISLEDVLKRTAKGIADSETHDVQRASYVSSLTDNLSLHDKVNCQDEKHRQNFDKMVSSWQRAHEEPSSLEIYSQHGLRVRLHFGAEFSNVLIVSIQHSSENPSIRQLGFCLDITPEGHDCESGLELEQVNEKPHARVDGTRSVNQRMQGLTAASRWCYRIKNLQRLPNDSELNITVSINYLLGPKVYNPRITHNCGRPLVSNMFPLALASARRV